MTPEQRRARAQKASRAAAIRTAYVLVTQTPEVFTPRQRDEMVSALALHVDSNSADPAEAPQTEVTP